MYRVNLPPPPDPPNKAPKPPHPPLEPSGAWVSQRTSETSLSCTPGKVTNLLTSLNEILKSSQATLKQPKPDSQTLDFRCSQLYKATTAPQPGPDCNNVAEELTWLNREQRPHVTRLYFLHSLILKIQKIVRNVLTDAQTDTMLSQNVST